MEKEEIIRKLFITLKSNSSRLNKVFDKSFNGMFSVLELLLLEEKPLLAGEIAKELNMKTSQVAFIIRTLKAKKYIDFKFDKDDKRKKYIFITKDGKSRIQKEESKYFGSFAESFRGLNNEELEFLLNIFEKLMR